jgi:shikimate dehydrogenase
VAVVGAGGAARAVIVALLDAGVPELRLTNRTRETAIRVGTDLAPTDGRNLEIVPGRAAARCWRMPRCW